MADRRYRPGYRNPRIRAAGAGKMSEHRFAWLRTAIGQLVIMRYEEKTPENDDTEIGPTIRLYIPRPGSRPFSINFTALNMKELKAMRKFLNMALDLAEPVVALRDKVAKDAFDAGDDSYARSYRDDPQLVVRERTLRQNGKGVHDGSQGLPERVGDDGDTDGGVRGPGPGLADPEPPQGSSQDNGSPVDQPEGVQQVGRVPELPQ